MQAALTLIQRLVHLLGTRLCLKGTQCTSVGAFWARSHLQRSLNTQCTWWKVCFVGDAVNFNIRSEPDARLGLPLQLQGTLTCLGGDAASI